MAACTLGRHIAQADATAGNNPIKLLNKQVINNFITLKI
jgi:hypothetical protein